ncbi:MAG: hypothetical protein LBS69_04275, partial [Prevotellaceae bacterium]|nr:hypothetical protein [Prevotellaceae bacterium]
EKGKKCRDETVIYVCEGKNEYTDGLLTGIIGANGERTQLEYDRDKPESRRRRMAGRTQVLPERFSGSTSRLIRQYLERHQVVPRTSSGSTSAISYD